MAIKTNSTVILRYDLKWSDGSEIRLRKQVGMKFVLVLTDDTTVNITDLGYDKVNNQIWVRIDGSHLTTEGTYRGNLSVLTTDLQMVTTGIKELFDVDDDGEQFQRVVLAMTVTSVDTPVNIGQGYSPKIVNSEWYVYSDTAHSYVASGYTIGVTMQMFEEAKDEFVANENSSADSDLDIADDEGNVVARFNEGHFKVKKFDSRLSADCYTGRNDVDFAISDESGKVLMQIKDGHISTKEFDSSNIKANGNASTSAKNVLYHLDSARTDFSLNGWTSTSSYIANNAYGYSNKLQFNREYTCSNRFFVWDVTFEEGAVLYFGVNSYYQKLGSPNGLISIDTSAKTLNFHKGGSTETITEVVKSVSIENDFVVGRKYRIKISRKDWTLTCKIYDLLTYEEVATLSNGISLKDKTIKVGQWYERPFVFSTTAKMKVYDFLVMAEYANPFDIYVWLGGDSITEGDQLPDYTYRYGDLMATDTQKTVIVSGRCAGNIENLTQKISSEMLIFKPQYAMITEGTNDTINDNYRAKMVSFVNTCFENGITPIINHVPAKASTASTNWKSANEVIESIISQYSTDEHPIYSARFDKATCIDYDLTKGQDSTLFADDKLHPNVSGHQRMFKQLKIDLPFLFNF